MCKSQPWWHADSLPCVTHSCSSPTFTPFSPSRLCRWLDSEREPRGCSTSTATCSERLSGSRSISRSAWPVRFDGIAQRRRQRVDQAALDAMFGHHELAATRDAAERRGHRLDRLAGELVAEERAPRHVEAAVGRPERRHGNARALQHGHPGAVGTELGPTAAAERQHHRIGAHRQFRRSRLRSAVRPLRSSPASDGAHGTSRRPRAADAARRAAAARPSCRSGKIRPDEPT